MDIIEKPKSAEMHKDLIESLGLMAERSLRYYTLKPTIGGQILTEETEFRYLIKLVTQFLLDRQDCEVRTINVHPWFNEGKLFYGFYKIKCILQEDKTFNKYKLHKRLTGKYFMPFIVQVFELQMKTTTIKQYLSASRYKEDGSCFAYAVEAEELNKKHLDNSQTSNYN